ncbi:ABC transporter permease [Terrisporobacter sp.]
MFFHNYKYRLKCSVRDRSMMFWTLLFPIILALLFNLALGNIGNAEDFQLIKIAVVNDSNFKKNKEFKKVLKEVSKNNKDALFNTKYVSKDKAKDLLKNNKIEGYIYLNKNINIVVNKSGLNQTILKTFVDEYKQTSSTMKNIISKNPKAIKKINKLLKNKDYIKEKSISKSSPDESINYFYTLIGMACLYGSFFGMKEINDIQANQSHQGARICISPTHKLKIFASSMLSVTTVQLFNMAILLLFLKFALSVNFSNNILYILLTCFMGTVTGVTFGTFIGIIMKKNENLKIGILIGSTMTMSFMSGMMYNKMKYIIANKLPILSYINPVNLIADSFYSLYFYDLPTKYFMDIGMLLILSLIFSLVTYFVLRGQKYECL